jgi:pimeloyl-ACP methyl ester carboxylesterase
VISSDAAGGAQVARKQAAKKLRLHSETRIRRRLMAGLFTTLMRLQQQIATLSPQGSLIVAQGSGHDVQLDRPETVIEAIRRMVAAVQAKP